MGRSSGARAKKGVAADVAVLREELATLTSAQWQRAYGIYKEISRLCGYEGPMGGSAKPRVCKYCRYFGHTREFCKKRKGDMKDEEALELKTHARWKAGRCVDVDEIWKMQMMDLDARYKYAKDNGCTGCTDEKDGWPCEQCEQCERFRHLFDTYNNDEAAERLPVLATDDA